MLNTTPVPAQAGQQPFSLCVFDLDGTLLNTLADLAASTNYALAQLGYPTHPVERYKRFVGDGILTLLQRAAGPNPVEEETLAQLKTLFDQHYDIHRFDQTAPYPGCCSMLEHLQEAGLLLAVLSNKPDEFVGDLLCRYFPSVRFFEAVGKRPGYAKKPDPAALLDLIARSGVEKSRCLYIGDSDVDVYTAHNAGIACCGALWGFRGYEELKNAGADCFAQEPGQVADIALGLPAQATEERR